MIWISGMYVFFGIHVKKKIFFCKPFFLKKEISQKIIIWDTYNFQYLPYMYPETEHKQLITFWPILRRTCWYSTYSDFLYTRKHTLATAAKKLSGYRKILFNMHNYGGFTHNTRLTNLTRHLPQPGILVKIFLWPSSSRIDEQFGNLFLFLVIGTDLSTCRFNICHVV